jgi:hypothetical protein
MKPADPCILTINGGSSSIKSAPLESGDVHRRILGGGIERIGLPEVALRLKGLIKTDNFFVLCNCYGSCGCGGSSDGLD